MSDAEKNAPAATAEAAEKETKIKTENDETEGDVQKDNEHQRTINVGNLPKDITEQQLRDHFVGHEVERVEIYHYLRNTLALLVFKEKTAAQKACDEKDGSMLNGRRLRIHLEYITIRYTKKDVIVVVVDDDMTEEKLFDQVKEHCEVTQVFIFFPLGYVHLGKDVDKTAVLEKLNAAGLKAYDVNGRDQNQHVDLWRAAKLFFRNRNRVQLLNVPQKWVENTEELKKACSEAGTITEAIANHVTQASSNYYARIFFETEEQAAKAAELLNGKVFEGKRIHALHLSSALLPNYKTSVYASPLERTVTEEDVYEHFKQFGDIDFVNRRNCVENAIICYKTPEAAEKALACTTFPTPTEANKEATKTITVKRYDGPLVLRAAGVKRKATTTQRTTPDGKTREPRTPGGADRDKSHKDILQKLQAFYPVYVSNIPFSCPTHVIREFFSSLGGEVKFIFSPQHYLPYRLSAPQPVKTAMVYYTRRNDMLNAIKQLDKKMLNNQHLHVLPGRGDSNFNQQKTVKLSKITDHLSEDAIFRKMRPLGKVVRLTKKSRSLAFVEFADSADVEKILKMKQEELPINCVFSKIVKDVSRRLYNETDPKILGTVVRLMRRNPKMLNKTTGAGPLMGGNNVVGGPGAFGGGKRPRMNGPPGFGNVPPFNPNNGGNNLNNNQAIQDLLRLAFMSGKNVGESLAAGAGNIGGNQGPNRGGGGGGSFNNADPPISNQGGGNNAFGGGGDGGFGAGGGGGGRNMNNRNQNMNFRGGNRNNQNNNVGGNRGLGNSNNNAGANNFGNQNQNNSGGPRGGGVLGGIGGNNSNNSNSGGGMMNNRGSMNNNMNNRNTGGNNNMNNMNKRGGGNNLQQQNSSMQLGGGGGGGVVGTGGSIGGNSMNKGSGGGMRGGNNNQGMGGGGNSGIGGGSGGNMGMNRSNNNMGGNNRNNRNNNNFNDNNSFGGGSGGGGIGGGNNNAFGGGSNNFSNDNFGGGRNNDNSYSNDNFGGGRNDNYSNDNFGGSSGGGGRNNFGNRSNDSYGSNSRNDNFGGGSSNFGGNSYNSNSGGSGSRFNSDNDGPFSGNSGGNNTGSGGNNAFGLNNNRGNNSSNSRFNSDDNLGGGGGGYGGGNTNTRGGNNFNDNSNNFGGSNRGSGGNQKPQGLFNMGGGSGGGNLGGGGNNMSYNNNFGGGNSNNSGGNNFRNNDNNKGGWMGGNNSNNSGLGGGHSNSNRDNIGRLAGSLFSRRF